MYWDSMDNAKAAGEQFISSKEWTLVAWRELRDDYRHFRIDRINKLTILDEKFETTKTKNLEHYLKQHAPDA